MHIFKPIIQSVIDFYKPTCIVLQVSLYWIHLINFNHGTNFNMLARFDSTTVCFDM